MASTNIGHKDDVVLFSNNNFARMITLNRLNKLNSLNTEMVDLMLPRLVEYSKSTVNNVIILTSNSPKALCAGGDVALCVNALLENNPQYPCDFFQKEYNLNYLISTCPKPYVAIMDKITMGGGVGLSVHAPFRIATEATKLAMPEMDIGFFPDVGTTFFLPRLDDKIGYYYALTGHVLQGAEAYMAGFATHFVRSEKIPQLINRLSNLQPPVVNDEPTDTANVIFNNSEYFALVNQAIEEFTENKLPENYQFPFTTHELDVIRNAFSQPTIEGVFEYLNKEGSEFSKKTLDKLSKKPTSSLKFAYELMNRGQKNSIRQQFELEMVAAANIMNIPNEDNDFVKGVEHKLIKKIKEPFFPQWTDGKKIDDKLIGSIMTKSIKTTKYLKNPLLNTYFGVDYKQYPFHNGLPTNQQIAEYITGNDGSGRSYLPTPSEVLSHFKKTTNNKVGVELKVKSALDLHGEASKYDGKYVTWKQ